MTDERLERLTELARKVWPAGEGHHPTSVAVGEAPPRAIVSADWLGNVVIIMHHPRALDMLEAALLEATGDYAPELEAIREVQKRAEAAEKRVKELEAQLDEERLDHLAELEEVEWKSERDEEEP